MSNRKKWIVKICPECGSKFNPWEIDGIFCSPKCVGVATMKAQPNYHGMYRSPEYTCWSHMLARCENPNCEGYRNYGGRGISVCKEWHSFKTFLKDMGLRPSVIYTIERKDNNGNYEPSNCMWATRKQQMNNTRQNRRVTVDGLTLTLTQAARKYGINPGTANSRRSLGWSDTDTFKSAVKPQRKKLIYQNKEWSLPKLASAFGVNRWNIRYFLRSGMSVEDAIRKELNASK